MFQLFCNRITKEKTSVNFTDQKEAEMYAKLLLHFNQNFWLVSDVYEYNALTEEWDNMAY